MRKRILAAVLCVMLFIMSPARAFAWYTEEPEDDGEAARGSFWDYEMNDPHSAFNTLAENGESIANFGYSADPLSPDAENVFSFFSGIKDIQEDYESPHQYTYLTFLDVFNRVTNETPISMHPAQVIATIAVDMLNYYADEINKPSAINEIFETVYYHMESLNPFNDFPSYSEKQVRNHTKLAMVYSFADAMRFYNFLKSKTEEIKGKAKEFMDLMNFAYWLYTKLPIDITVYKPNIYLYGDAGTELNVTFTEEELLIKVLPEYQDTWNCVIEEDGSLTVDGQEGLPYLFYECKTFPALMQTETGFVITPEGRAAQLEELMISYGFNEQETQDFVEYWDEHLDPETTYYVFPQETETVDKAMPIEADQERLESYYRIWFYFLEEGTTEKPAPCTIHPVRHDGLSLIEWGVIL